jgi:predicted nucleic acid-binding protein
MKAVFGDTVYFLALLYARDQFHRQAVELSEHPPGPLVPTEWILTELADALAVPPARERFVQLLGMLRGEPEVEIVPASHELFERGCVLFGQRKDKAWSLTDGVSFVVMRDRGLETALTADQHFEQAGFRRLILP